MSVDMSLFLQNVHVALANQQYQHATFLLDYAITLAEKEEKSPACSSLDVSMGLHRGRVREANEDCLFAISGIFPEVHRSGLYVVCDGMGGHVRGQEAAHLAIQTIVEALLPQVVANPPHAQWEHLLADALQQANRAILLRNQSLELQSIANGVPVTMSQFCHMGTTVTAVLLCDHTAYVANVGDSRTYLYDQSLHKITTDHSLVAQLLADGLLEEEEIYVHPLRNQITRALGSAPSVQIDTFVVPLHGHEILLLCSDGLWEMTRDRTMEVILASSWANAAAMAHRLVQIANENGGADNIGCIVIQLQRQTDTSSLETMLIDPIAALNRLVMSTQ
ncbi:MAG: serine/threonine-protein phosphatase [Ktedonobacteraceae bacterium]|nr:serine/threonine-protein phosphatase [Ktedonobacteraceae bacterium]